MDYSQVLASQLTNDAVGFSNEDEYYDQFSFDWPSRIRNAFRMVYASPKLPSFANHSRTWKKIRYG